MERQRASAAISAPSVHTPPPQSSSLLLTVSAQTSRPSRSMITSTIRFWRPACDQATSQQRAAHGVWQGRQDAAARQEAAARQQRRSPECAVARMYASTAGSGVMPSSCSLACTWSSNTAVVEGGWAVMEARACGRPSCAASIHRGHSRHGGTAHTLAIPRALYPRRKVEGFSNLHAPIKAHVCTQGSSGVVAAQCNSPGAGRARSTCARAPRRLICQHHSPWPTRTRFTTHAGCPLLSPPHRQLAVVQVVLGDVGGAALHNKLIHGGPVVRQLCLLLLQSAAWVAPVSRGEA